MFTRKAHLALKSHRALLSRCCALIVGLASCASALAADAVAYRYLDENGAAAYSQYPPADIFVSKVYTRSGLSGETPRPRYGEDSRYAAARRDSSPELERRQAKIAAEARENKRAAQAAAECRRNHEIGCKPGKTVALSAEH